MNKERTGASRWHREPLVWMVLAIPAAAVVAGAVMLVLASVTWDGLVADDYYRRGMQINRSLTRDAEAARLAVEAVLSFPAAGVVEVRLSGEGALAGGGPPALRFARAARAGADVVVRLAPGAGGAWRGALPALPRGKWYVELGTERWRLTAPVWLPARAGDLALRPSGPPRPAGS